MNISRYSKIGYLAGVSLLSGSAGYWIAKRRIQKQADADIQSVKDTYAKLTANATKYKDPQEAVEALVGDIEEEREDLRDKVTTLAYAERVVEQDEEERLDVEASQQTELNIFEIEPEPAGIEVPAPLPSDPNHPYVISIDQFGEGVDGFEQTVLTYYEGDDTLVDDSEQVIDDAEHTVGNINLSKFGMSSRDNNIVYVRNEKLQMDFEILRDKRGYGEAAFGIVPEPKNRPQKMRNDE